MANEYLTAEQAIEKANELFDKRELNKALQHFEYANRIKPSEQSAMGIILVRLIINKDLKSAMQRVDSIPFNRYPREVIFKAYRAVIAQYYYISRIFYVYPQDDVTLSNNTRRFIENYLTNNFGNLQRQIGEENANTIRLMLLKVLLQSYSYILNSEVCIGEERLPDTYNLKTEGTTWNYGHFSETKLTTTVETQKNSRSKFMRGIDFIGETMNELNFQIRCKEILDEIHKADPYYITNGDTNTKNLNYLLSGYLKYKTHKKMKVAAKRKSFYGTLMFFSGAYSGMLALLKTVVVKDTPFFALMRIIGPSVLILSIIFYFKERRNEHKYKIGEYEIEPESIKKSTPHSNL